MSPQRWQQTEEILHQAVARPSGERRAFLERACGGDGELRREVESLLEFDAGHDFVDGSAWSIHGEDPDLGRAIGPYRTVRLLGRGGMGAVYLAVREEDYTGQVALKVIKRGMDSAEIVRRFHTERQILADLDHPHVARLLDGGTTDDGRPYFVMDYVEGEPLDQYCDARKLSIAQRLGLFRQICSAVELAHRNLVVHRDLKPGNILVTRDAGTPKLLDFGIAKLLEPGLAATAQDQRPMTFSHASPEQVRGGPVTTATDVYSLGVLLYQLLTGHHPHDLEDPGSCPRDEIVRRIGDQEPQKPSSAIHRHKQIRRADGTTAVLTPESVSRTREGEPRRLRQRLVGDLDAIVLKALRKEPRRRYGSVERFSADVGRYLRGLPVTARRGNFSYRAGKFVRRNRWAISVLLLVLGFAVTTMLQWRSSVLHKHEDAMRELRTAERVSDFLESLFESWDPDQARGKPLTVSEILARGKRELDQALEEEPLIRIELLDTLGTIYRNLGHYRQALELMAESLRLVRQLFPGDHPQVAARLNNLSVVYYDLGDHENAEKYAREALEMRRRLGQADAPEIVRTLSNLASILMTRGDYSGAEALYRRGLRIRLERYGLTHPNVATSLRHLGNLFHVRGEPARAEPLLRRALEIRRRHFGSEHPKVALVLDKLGSVRQALGDEAEAEELFTAALAIQRRQLEDNHLALAHTRRNLAALLLARQDPSREEIASAGILLQQVLRALYRAKPAGDWEIADAESLLGAYLMRLGRYQAAEPCLVASHAVLVEARSKCSCYARAAGERIVELYRAWGKPEKLARYRRLSEASCP